RPVLVSILRAGLGMVEPLVELLPEAAVWHLGIYRDHDTLQPVTYRDLLPQQHDRDWAILLDPMLATGGSAITAVDRLLQRGIRRIHFIGFIAAPEGVAALQNAHPDVRIHLAAIDHHLNEHGYIFPGLGDAGDRQFATL
ncbi:MAG: uracil phosphoribosyltransferase, partial [Gemmataceae bacterium]